MKRRAVPPNDPRRALGRLGEDEAAAHLRRLGFRIVERNLRTRHGEIDLIAFDGKTLVIVEVKTRRMGRSAGNRADGAQGSQPSDPCYVWPRTRQRARLRRLAHAWLSESQSRRPTAEEIRFDAIAVMVDQAGALLRLDHIESAW
jgi:putative endonuclease